MGERGEQDERRGRWRDGSSLCLESGRMVEEEEEGQFETKREKESDAFRRSSSPRLVISLERTSHPRRFPPRPRSRRSSSQERSNELRIKDSVRGDNDVVLGFGGVSGEDVRDEEGVDGSADEQETASENSV